MLVFEPNSRHLGKVLLFVSIRARRILPNTYDEAALGEGMCRKWVQRSQNGDFDRGHRYSSGKEKVCEDVELEALRDRDAMAARLYA